MNSENLLAGRWVVFSAGPREHSTDALAQWANLARAHIEWDMTTTRLDDGAMVYTVIPRLTCIKCHPLMDRDGATLILSCSDPNEIERVAAKTVGEWRASCGNGYLLVGFAPYVSVKGGISVTICYKLNGILMQDCWGAGRSLKEAKAMAAMKLLSSGHCVGS
ncbi:unnamed protein product [Rhizoctonia solani]|uniref:DRBM domain-containing protein n=1 Tax=Rhizoctonia solani TaxID=456999 RepID=A0A8H3HXN3_9AGAM|nr:unnamed protein product [Rhizoctonia solani]